MDNKNKIYFSSPNEIKKKYAKNLFTNEEEKRKGISKNKLDIICLQYSSDLYLLKSHLRVEYPILDYKKYLGIFFKKKYFY